MRSRALGPAVWTIVSFLVLWHVGVAASVFAPVRLIGMTAQGSVVDEVARGSPAEQAGLRPKDRYDLDDPGTKNFVSGILNGEVKSDGSYPITVIRAVGGHEQRLRLTMHPRAQVLFQSYTVRALVLIANSLAFIVCILLTGWLVARRPTVMTAALAAATLSFGVPQMFGLPYPLSLIAWTFSWIAFQHGFTAAIVVFALRFPDDRVDGWRSRAQTVALVFMAISEAVVAAAAISAALKKTSPEVLYGDYVAAFSVIQAVAVVAAAIIVLARFQASEERTRGQLAWGACGMVIALAAYVLSLINTPYSPSENWEAIGVIAFLGVPLCAAHALLRTRFVDPRIVWNRAAVFGVTLILLTVLFKSLEWLAEHLFPGAGQFIAARIWHTPAGQAQAQGHDIAHWLVIGATAVVSVALASAHKWMQWALEQLVFRDKIKARTIVRNLGASLAYAPSETVVESVLAYEAPRQMGLTSAAHFAAAGRGTFVRRNSSPGWNAAHSSKLGLDDNLIRLVVTQRKPVRTADVGWSRDDSPSGNEWPDLAVPVVLRDEVVAIDLYGPHKDHFEIDADEIETLSDLADHAAWAMDHIRAETLEQALQLLQSNPSSTASHDVPSPAPDRPRDVRGSGPAAAVVDEAGR